MIRLLKCEFLKTRRRYIFLSLLAVTAIGLFWTLNGRVSEDMRRLGWMIYLYQLPVTNSIVMPLLAMIAASRQWDLEHRSGMLRRLIPASGRGKLYDVKLLTGLGAVLVCCLINWAVIVIYGHAKGFYGPFPLRLYMLHLLSTLLPTAAVYLLQSLLSMAFKNQAAAFAVGIAGTFAGMFSMFLPQLPWLRRFLIWGGYGALNLVGMYGYTKETRWRDVWFEVSGPDPYAVIFLLCAGLTIYFFGKRLFCLKEV